MFPFWPQKLSFIEEKNANKEVRVDSPGSRSSSIPRPTALLLPVPAPGTQRSCTRAWPQALGEGGVLISCPGVLQQSVLWPSQKLPPCRLVTVEILDEG